jgi:hypothetical protein
MLRTMEEVFQPVASICPITHVSPLAHFDFQILRLSRVHECLNITLSHTQSDQHQMRIHLKKQILKIDNDISKFKRKREELKKRWNSIQYDSDANLMTVDQFLNMERMYAIAKSSDLIYKGLQQ